jgi:hypothetical protein
VVGKSFLRRVAFRPSERAAGEDLFHALAGAICAKGVDGVGLHEVGKVETLAGVLRDGPEHAHGMIETALDALTDQARAAGKILDHEQAVLLLIIDQLEELFTDHSLTTDQRRRFVATIGALARSKRVWVVASMRADLWHRASETPALVALAEGLGRFDLLPPGPAELSQMIRLPADAAGLSFEVSAVDGVPLNDRIAEEAADAPGVLPLLSYLLEQLYQTDAVEAHGSVLTYASYQDLGRLKGAIAARAETILANQPDEVRAALRSVLFSLVQTNTDASGATTMTARRAPLSAFKDVSPARTLIDAFLDPKARLLIAESGGDGPATVRVAHEALLSEWTRARDCIADDAVLLAIRRTTEERYARWLEIGPGRRPWWAFLDPEQGVLTGADLGDARRLYDEYRVELPMGLVQYIERSTRQDRRRRQGILIGLVAIAISMTALAATGVSMAYLAELNAVEARVQLEHSQLLNVQNDADDARTVSKNQTAAVAGYGKMAKLANDLIGLQPNEPLWRYDLGFAHTLRALSFDLRAQTADKARSQAEYRLALAAFADCARIDAKTSVQPDRVEMQGFIQQHLPSGGMDAARP